MSTATARCEQTPMKACLACADSPELQTEQLSDVVCGDLQWHVETSRHTEAHEDYRKPVCLLLHGTGASCHSWTTLVPYLSKHFTVISVDLPGHARTVTPAHVDLSLPGIADALHALVEQKHWQPSLIVGHSAGAAIMVELCLRNANSAGRPRYENTRLVSINGALLPLGGLAGWVFSPLAKLSASASWLPRLFAYRASDPRQVRRLLESTGSTISPSSLKSYEQLFRDPVHVAGVLRMMANWRLEALQARLPELNQSIHLIAATADRTIPLRDVYRLNALFRQSSLTIIENKGHLVHEEDPSRVAALILEQVS